MKGKDLAKSVVIGDNLSAFMELREMADKRGIILASINELYLARGRGEIATNFTVPAVNLRGMTYHTARTLLKTAKKLNGFWIFEIARSEMGYTGQYPMEYAAEIIGAAIDEEWEGPLFLQGDHFQFKNAEDIENMKRLVDEALQAGFYNIDIDGSTLVDLKKETVLEQQQINIKVTTEMLNYIRNKQGSVEISVGGEIGHIGEKNSTVEDMRIFLEGVGSGLSKVSVQTGTRHGGAIDSAGETLEMKVDFEVIDECGEEARKWGVGGVVQHGASTLKDEQLSQFTKHNTLEIHLATGWQNIILDSESFPRNLARDMEEWVLNNFGAKYKTIEECMYRERKKAWGQFQNRVWDIEEKNVEAIMEEVGERGTIILNELGMKDRSEILRKYI